MKMIRIQPKIRVVGIAALLFTVGMNAIAQGSIAVGEKVSGAQLQSWLDQKFMYAGVHQSSQCVILNAPQGEGRVLFIRCPNGWTEKLPGSARVVGDTYCTSFPIPNAHGEDCVTWYSVGQWRFEQRKGNALDTAVIMLPQGLIASK